MRDGIDPQRPHPVLQHVRLPLQPAPEYGAHPQDELAHAERLGDEVVGAQLEPDDAVHLLAAGGDHDDRDVLGARRALQLPAHLGPRNAGEHQIEQHQIGKPMTHEIEGLFAVARASGLESALPQIELHEIQEVFLVLDAEDELRACHARFIYRTHVATM